MNASVFGVKGQRSRLQRDQRTSTLWGRVLLSSLYDVVSMIAVFFHVLSYM